jgi:hypothetical protein
MWYKEHVLVHHAKCFKEGDSGGFEPISLRVLAIMRLLKKCDDVNIALLASSVRFCGCLAGLLTDNDMLLAFATYRVILWPLVAEGPGALGHFSDKWVLHDDHDAPCDKPRPWRQTSLLFRFIKAVVAPAEDYHIEHHRYVSCVVRGSCNHLFVCVGLCAGLVRWSPKGKVVDYEYTLQMDGHIEKGRAKVESAGDVKGDKRE